MNKLFEAFDIKEYLDSRGISYSESGKNISSNWIGTACIFCEDNSTHLGIHIRTKNISCFRCGVKGSILKYIQEIDHVPMNKAYQIIEQFQDQSYSYLDQIQRKTTDGEVTLPKGSSKNFPGIFTNYLSSRNFNPAEIIKKYDLYCCHLIGDFKFRIIAPVIMQRELVSYTGRDITNKSNLRYKNYPIEQSKIPIKECLYNIDSVRDKVIIVEGITDVWRMGDECVATFGTQYTRSQIALLTGIKKAFVLYDADAATQAEKLANDLSVIISYVEVITLDSGDPADLLPIDAIRLKKSFFT
jgi:DNA primase